MGGHSTCLPGITLKVTALVVELVHHLSALPSESAPSDKLSWPIYLRIQCHYSTVV